MKSLIRLCFRRPVTVGATCALLVVLAGVAFVRLPVALLPDLGYPALTVWTPYPDVPPERVERAVTEPVEEAVAGTRGLERITARSQLGGSLVEMRFGWNTDLDLALLEVREQIDRLGNRLPDDADRPVILRVDPSQRPVMMLSLREQAVTDTSAGPQVRRTRGRENQPGEAGTAPQNLVQLREVGREVIARRLEQLRGVARVRVTGGYEQQVSINLDRDRMASYGLSVGDVASALEAANASLPSGSIRRGPFRFAVEVSGEFETAEDVGRTVVRRAGATTVRLDDVAEVRMGVAERRGLVRYDGREALLLLVERRPGANTVQTAADVREALDQLEQELPDVALDVVVDQSVFIEEAIGGVVQAVLLGGVLAIVVLLGFLRRRRPLLAVAVAVPLSLGITLVAFEAMGVTFNLIALSGLALGVGLLVDNAIIVVENVARLREEGLGPVEAARQGAEEVAGAITASTLTTIAVFLPITFVEGLAGRLFRDQSLAVVGSLLASLLVALTVVPLLLRGASGMGEEGEDEDDSDGTERLRGSGLMQRYESGLRWSLDHPGAVLGLAAAVLVGAGALGWTLPREVVPPSDQGRVEAHLTLDPGSDLPLVSARAQEMEQTARGRGWAAHVLADVGERNAARLELDPRPPYEADLTFLLPDSVGAEQAIRRLQAVDTPPDVTMEVESAKTRLEELLSSGEGDLLIDLVADTRRRTEGVADTLLRRLQASPELTGVRRAEAAEVPAYRLELKREAMARFGVQPADVAGMLEAAARGRRATELRRVSEEIPIVVRARDVRSVDDLLQRRIPTPTGQKPLRVFVEARQVDLPAALIRAEQAPVVRLVANVAPDSDLQAAVDAVRSTFETSLPPGVRGSVGGANEAFRDSLRAVGWSLLLSILVVYLILTAQFERLLQPLVILTAVPLAAAGVAVVLWVTGQSVNLMSLTGCVVLVGIVVNDAIIKVDFINQRREAGMDLRAAIEDAGRDRLRPILMTTITTILGLLPLALGIGAGAEIRAPLAIAIAGGLAGATGLTLFVVPVLVQAVARSLRGKHPS
jgi:HAE1 family hydrophobic/amphiphilic exporter-1